MSNILRIQSYAWCVEGLSGSDELATLKRHELKRIFQEAQNLLKLQKVHICVIALTDIRLASYQELQFRLQEMDLIDEIEINLFEFSWLDQAQGGAALFWKSLPSKQLIITEKLLPNVQTPHTLFTECSVVSESLISEAKLLLGVCSVTSLEKEEEIFESVVAEVAQGYTAVVMACSFQNYSDPRQSVIRLNRGLRDSKNPIKLWHSNREHRATSTCVDRMDDFILSNAKQSDLKVSEINSYEVCIRKDGGEPALCKEKLYKGRLPIESRAKIPLNFFLKFDQKKCEEIQLTSPLKRENLLLSGLTERLEDKMEKILCENTALHERLERAQEYGKIMTERLQQAEIMIAQQREEIEDFKMESVRDTPLDWHTLKVENEQLNLMNELLNTEISRYEKNYSESEITRSEAFYPMGESPDSTRRPSLAYSLHEEEQKRESRYQQEIKVLKKRVEELSFENRKLGIDLETARMETERILLESFLNTSLSEKDPKDVNVTELRALRQKNSLGRMIYLTQKKCMF